MTEIIKEYRIKLTGEIADHAADIKAEFKALAEKIRHIIPKAEVEFYTVEKIPDKSRLFGLESVKTLSSRISADGGGVKIIDVYDEEGDII